MIGTTRTTSRRCPVPTARRRSSKTRRAARTAATTSLRRTPHPPASRGGLSSGSSSACTRFTDGSSLEGSAKRSIPIQIARHRQRLQDALHLLDVLVADPLAPAVAAPEAVEDVLPHFAGRL